MFLILFLITVLGCYFAFGQILFLREFLVIFYGNELSIGIILSLWLAGITVGAFLGGLLSRFYKDAVPFFFLIISIISILLLPEIYMVRLTRLIFDVPAGEYIPFAKIMISTALRILPFTILTGAFFTVASRLVGQLSQKSGPDASPIGKVYIAECVGSIFGGVFFTFFLVELENQFFTVGISIFVISLITIIAYLREKKDLKRSLAIFPSLALIIFIPVMIFSGNIEKINERSIQERWKGFNANLEFIRSTDTKYENLSLGHQEGMYSVFGNGHYMLSFPDRYQYAATAHISLSEHPDPKNVLLIGGGMGGLIEEILKHPVTRLDYVELDPELITLVKSYLSPPDDGFLKDGRLHIHYSDGRFFVKSPGEKYDLIIVNVSDPSTAVINRYYTVEFYKEAAGALAPGGVLATKISSAGDYIGKEIGDYSGSVYHSIKKIFPHLVVTPGTENYFFASRDNGVVTANPDLLIKRFLGSGAKTRYFSSTMFYQMFQPARVRFINDALERSGPGLINTDLKPITYYLNLILWDKYSGSKIACLFETIRKVNYRYILAFLIAILLIRILYSKTVSTERNNRFNTIITIFTTGMAGMAFEIALIFMFQNVYGYVYQKIGLIIAMFMFGLAAGGLLTNSRVIKHGIKERGLINIFIVFEFMILAFSLAIPVSIWWVSKYTAASIPAFYIESFFYLLVFISGFLTGGEFPLASRLYFATGIPLGRTAGLIDAYDCLGAALGAILTGIFILPLFGLAQTCLLLAVLKGGCIILLVQGKQNLNKR
ncbi:fused MFS/spermidine synthase [Candidatus Auribacterota bacterium]